MKKEMTIKEMAIEFNNIIADLTEINIAHDFKAVKKFSTKPIGIKRLNKVQEILKVARIQEEKENDKKTIQFGNTLITHNTNQKPAKESKKVGRKTQVLAMLKQGDTTMTFIAETLNISKKNISSVLTYLRKEGHSITTKRDGKNHIVTIG